MRYTVSSARAKNDTPDKPFEDCISMGKDTFVVADGVTRPHEEYRPGCEDSLASRAAAVIADTICRGLSEEADPSAAARATVLSASDAMAEMNRQACCDIPAAAVFVGAAIRGDTLHFSYLGDSLILLIRGGVRIWLSEQQTAHLRVYGSTAGLHITRRQLHDTITNNFAHPLGYGVVNGDRRAIDFLRAAPICLQHGDRVILSSDGLDKYLSYEREAPLAALTPEEMIAASLPYDKPPYAERTDDKAVVILDIQ